MAEKIIKVPIITGILEEISKICLNAGLTRRTSVEDNSLRASGEAGIGTFEIAIVEKKDNDFIMKIRARNDQAISIVSNLVETGINDLIVILNKEKSKVLKKKYSCAVCQETLNFLNKKSLFGDLKVDVMVCPKCHRIEFFKEEK